MMRRACMRSARNRASVDFPTRSGPSMAIYRGGSNAGGLATRFSGFRGMARNYSRNFARRCPHKINWFDFILSSVVTRHQLGFSFGQVADILADSGLAWSLLRRLLHQRRGPAADGEARACDDRRGQERPISLCIASASGGDSHRKSRQRHGACSSTLTRGTCAGQFPTWKFRRA